MNVLINTVNIDFQEATVNGMPLPQDDADVVVRFKLIGKDLLELEDIKNLQQTHLSNALWQDGERLNPLRIGEGFEPKCGELSKNRHES